MHDLLDMTRAAADAHARFAHKRQALMDEATRPDIGDPLARASALTALTDDWLTLLWRECAPDAPCRLHALGSYGRRLLSFYSDLDVLVEVLDPAWLDDPSATLAVERWMAWCRHARLKLSHVVRTEAQSVAELSRDPRTPIALLDARPLGALDGVGQDHAARAAAFLRADDDGRRFCQALLDGMRARHSQHGQTVYLLEPDVKAGVGGMRDAQALCWAATARWDITLLGEQPAADAPGWDEGQRSLLRAHLSWMLGVRQALHARHGRKHDRLNFPDQLAIAGQSSDHDLAARTAIESLMRAHYSHARGLSQTALRALRQWAAHLPAPRPMTGPGQLVVTGPLLARDATDPLTPSEVFSALAIARDHDLELAPALEAEILRACERWDDATRDSLEVRRGLHALLLPLHQDARSSERLLALGVLTAALPELSPLLCHVHHDTYHVYTTDTHTLLCLERARRLLSGAPDVAADRWPMFRQIAAQIPQPELLLWAALFHDVGKNRGGDHSRIGAAMIPELGRRLGLDEGAREELAFLVREHLCLSHTARRRDISDRRVLRDLAARIRTVEALDLLTALTFCDITTVGPQVMTDWTAQLLTQLHHRLRAVIERGESAWTQQRAQVVARRAALRELLTPEAEDPDAASAQARVEEFLRDVPATHAATCQLDALARQLLVYAQSLRLDAPVARWTRLSELGITEVIVSCPDRPGALAMMAGALSACGLDILTAEIITTASGHILDLFRVMPQAQHQPGAPAPPEPDARRLDELVHVLTGALAGTLDVDALLNRRLAAQRLAPRPAPSVPCEIVIDQEASDDLTILEVKAADRPSLLYRIATVLHAHGLATRFSKVDSQGNKAVDVFYVEDALRGGKIEGARLDRVCADILEDITADPTHAPGGPV